MKAELVQAASEVITSPQILVNMVSRRVRQLTLGHRPLVVCAPGLGAADIALTEIANGKLTFESTFGQNGTAEPAARIVLFPDVAESKKAKKAVAKKAASTEDWRRMTLALFSLEEPSKCQRLHELSLRDRRRVTPKTFASEPRGELGTELDQL